MKLDSTDTNMKLYLKDITQTYVQFITNLNRDFYIRSSIEIIDHLELDKRAILKVVKSLYDVSKVENH